MNTLKDVKIGKSVKVIKLQGGKDPDEIIRTHGKESFAKLLNTADNDTEYKLSVIRSKYDVDTPDGKVNFLREAATFLAGADALGRDVYAMRLSDELGVSKDAILQHIKEAAKREHYRKAKTEFSDAQKKAQEMEKNVDPQRVKNKSNYLQQVRRNATWTRFVMASSASALRAALTATS